MAEPARIQDEMEPAQRELGAVPDSDLVKAAKRGDARACSELFERYRRSIMAYCSLATNRDRDRAREFTQEIFERTFGAVLRISKPENFRGFLFTVAANVCRTRGG